jgi:hypothetical protein
VVFLGIALSEVHLDACFGKFLCGLNVLRLHILALAAVRKVEHDQPDFIRGVHHLVPVFGV